MATTPFFLLHTGVLAVLIGAGPAAAADTPAPVAIRLGGDATLTPRAEVRLRVDAFDNAQLARGDDPRQRLLRGVLGADLRVNDHVRAYGEIATGQVGGDDGTAGANFQNDLSLQQLFVDVSGHVGATRVGAMVGRQEFADGPRQLVSLGDGPNLHRTWNGVRVYAHGSRARVGAFDLRATQPGAEFLDEEIGHDERLRGVNASVIVSRGDGPGTCLDPFWIHSERPGFRSGGQVGVDDRDTYGVRVRGRRGALRFDWTLARQGGRYIGRDIDAWGMFAVHSLALSGQGWKPRLTSHIDIASGGAHGSGALRTFHPLYASSNYLGEGRFLSLANLLLVAPGIAVSPTPRTDLSLEYGFARRLDERDAVYAGGMRAYAGTATVPGRAVGGLLRVSGTWAANERVTLFFNFEQLDAGGVLERAGLPSGRYAALGATYRY